MNDDLNQTDKQKLIEFANDNEKIKIMIELIKMSFPQEPLLGDTEYSTIVNAVKFDTRQTLIVDLLKQVNRIRTGEFITQQ